MEEKGSYEVLRPSKETTNKGGVERRKPHSILRPVILRHQEDLSGNTLQFPVNLDIYLANRQSPFAVAVSSLTHSASRLLTLDKDK